MSRVPEMNVLFICRLNRARSLTAEHLYADCENIHVKSAGFHRAARVPVSYELLAWADLVFTMEASHIRLLSKRYGEQWLYKRQVACLDIPDHFNYMSKRLCALLVNRVNPILQKVYSENERTVAVKNRRQVLTWAA